MKYIRSSLTETQILSWTGVFWYNREFRRNIRQLKVADGEMFTDTDIKAASKVCILGQTVVDYLFPTYNIHLFDITYNCDLAGLAHMHKGHEYIKCTSWRVISKFIITQFYLTGNKKIRPTQSKAELGAGSNEFTFWCPPYLKLLSLCVI